MTTPNIHIHSSEFLGPEPGIGDTVELICISKDSRGTLLQLRAVPRPEPKPFNKGFTDTVSDGGLDPRNPIAMPKPAGRGRTAQEIVDQTERLARQLAKIDGYTLVTGTGTIRNLGARAKGYWHMACIAQQTLTNTDPNDALSELE